MGVEMNWGFYIGCFSVFQCVACAVGYACARDVRHALYFTFAAAITLNVIWR